MRIKDVEDVVSLKVDGPQLHVIRKAVWKEIRETLNLGPDDNNNWDIVPITTMEIEED